MTESENAADELVGCPTCKVRQSWSDACRRCKCDLTLLGRIVQSCGRTRRRCLEDLRAGRFSQAVRRARRGFALSPDERSARLLAVCLLCRGEFVEAVRVFRAIDAARQSGLP
ncbi:MAG TPA: hypothetical protein VMY42_15915 [Thermoguttaceae bacterium]|nr:hypothetical protein [Thermoguttaceae bacterium]